MSRGLYQTILTRRGYGRLTDKEGQIYKDVCFLFNLPFINLPRKDRRFRLPQKPDYCSEKYYFALQNTWLPIVTTMGRERIHRFVAVLGL